MTATRNGEHMLVCLQFLSPRLPVFTDIESLRLCRPSILDSCLLLSFWCVFHCLLMQFFMRWFTRLLEIYLGCKGLIVIWNLSNQQLLVAKILIPGINVFHPNFEHHSGNCNLILTFFLAPPCTLVVLPKIECWSPALFFHNSLILLGSMEGCLATASSFL